jgi:hypothetical protein
MQANLCLSPLVAVLTLGTALGAGPEAGKSAPPLKLFDATGAHAGSEADYAAERKDQPTLYVFVQADKWDRPMARFLRALDEGIAKADDNAYLVGVWLTADVTKTKQYLPLAQQSLQLRKSALTCYADGKDGPPAWGIDLGASLTVVVAVKGKVVESRDYRSVNETVAPEILKTLTQAIKQP